jgi:hypothetical protein
MKLNRGLVAAMVATFVVGSVAVIGCARSDDAGDDAEQASVSVNEAASTVAGGVGVEQYARAGGAHGGFAHGGGFGRGGFGRGGGHGRAGWDHGGFARGGRWGGWDWRRDHRYFPWW